MRNVSLTDGGAEAVKWLALFLMVGDHANKYLFNNTLPFLFEAGRLCAPLFVIVLAWNLARPGASHRAGIVALRLVAVGLIASIPFIALGKVAAGWYPLNILFGLACVAALVALRAEADALALQGRNGARLGIICAAVALFVVGGGLVEFWWPLLCLGVGAYTYFTRPSMLAAAMVLLGFAGLCLINQNLWAFLAIPVLHILGQLAKPTPRFKWFFYAFYPAHLAGLWLIRFPMARAGYLFF